MEFEVKDMSSEGKAGWTLLRVSDRVDAFNYDDLMGRINQLIQDGRTKLAVDLERVSFLSLPSIRYLAQTAQHLHQVGGDFALVGPSEKIKRQIDIFASLDSMSLYRTNHEWIESEPEI